MRRDAGRGNQTAQPNVAGERSALEAPGAGRAEVRDVSGPCRGKVLSRDRRRRALKGLQEFYRVT